MSLGGLGTPPSSHAVAITADGSTVVGVTMGNLIPSRWTAGGGFALLDPSIDGTATGISDDGSIIVGSARLGNAVQAYRWTSETGFEGLGTIDGLGLVSFAEDVSADGSDIVGWSDTGSGEQAFLWTAENGMQALGTLTVSTDYSSAFAISADGSVIVGATDSAASVGGQEAFRWTSAGGMVGLGFLPHGDDQSGAFGISPDGSTIVGAAGITLACGTSGVRCHREAFRWTSASGMVGLGILPGFEDSVAMDASGGGEIIVGSSSITSQVDRPSTAVIWDAEHGLQPLDQLLSNLGIDLTGWQLREAVGVSADGSVITGNGRDPSGRFVGWIAVIPEPGTASLVGVGLFAFSAGRNAHRRRSSRILTS